MCADYSDEVREWLDERTKWFMMEVAPGISDEVREIPSEELTLSVEEHKNELTRRVYVNSFEKRITEDDEEEDENSGGLSAWT